MLSPRSCTRIPTPLEHLPVVFTQPDSMNLSDVTCVKQTAVVPHSGPIPTVNLTHTIHCRKSTVTIPIALWNGILVCL